MRILVTGSRDWPYPEVVYQELHRAAAGHYPPVTVVEGACPSGADDEAHQWVVTQQALGDYEVVSERHPADWAKHGRGAGFIRNQEMVDLGADLCLAFLLNHSRGTLDCMRRAEMARIPIRVIELNITERSSP